MTFFSLRIKVKCLFLVKITMMKINSKHGIDKLLFGMKQKDVETLYGKPDKTFKDDDQNVILLYNRQKWRLTFYEEDAFRMGYIICSHPELMLFDYKVIGSNVESVKKDLAPKGIRSWEIEDYDLAENHFNEDNWLILQSEFGMIVKVELGVVAKNLDEFDWKF